MINSLLGKVVGFLEKDFLFASFLPALLFVSGVAATLAVVTGVEGSLAVMQACSALQRTAISAGAGVALIVFAYVLSALRPAFARFWSGTSHFPLYLFWGSLRLVESMQRWRFLRNRTRSRRIARWHDILDAFENAVRAQWKTAGNAPGRFAVALLRLRVRFLHEGMERARVQARLRPLIAAYGKYSGNALTEIFQAVKLKLIDWEVYEAGRIQRDTFLLDRQFGSLDTVRATTLGNAIESLNQYPTKRYKMEAELFWSRLLVSIKPEYLTLVQEPRIALDFCLTTASLAAIYAWAALLVGPWLWFAPYFWGPLAAAACSISFLFYRLSIECAQRLGEMVRASFDLFRLDLMAALWRPHPATLAQEQRQWEELSKLAVYGTAIDFNLRPRTS